MINGELFWRGIKVGTECLIVVTPSSLEFADEARRKVEELKMLGYIALVDMTEAWENAKL